jgi:glyoxylase-like metal-dependent hydrolase (beta-lactamase superfamily II)
MSAQQQAPPVRAEAKGEPLRAEWCINLPRPGYTNLHRVRVESDWFEVYRVRPGVFAIYEPRQYEEVISYLLIGSQRALLFDTGLGIGDIRKVVAQLTPLPVTVLNSHTHFDHIGNNWQFADLLGLDTPYTHRNEAGATRDEVKEVVLPERFCGDPPAGFEPGKYQIRPFRVTRFVKDGEVIDLGDRRLEVVRTPGHTPDALCLLDRKNRFLLTGDTFYAGPIFLYVPESNLADYERSVEKLAKLAPHVDLLLPGHNFPAEKSEMLVRLRDAFRQVLAGTAKFRMDGDRREYLFEGFTILTAEP